LTDENRTVVNRRSNSKKLAAFMTGRSCFIAGVCVLCTYKYKIRLKNYTKVQNNTTKVRITNGKMHNKII